MSLEDALEKNTAALTVLAETIRASDALRAELLKRSDDVIASAATKSTKATKAEKADEPRQISDSPESRAPAAEKKAETPVEAEVSDQIKIAQDKVVAFLNGVQDEAGRTKRRGDVAEILKKLGASRVSELSPKDAGRLAGAIDTLTERYAAAPKPEEDSLV